MPVITTTRPTPPPATDHAPAAQIPGVVSASSLTRRYMKVCLYGKNRVGKSTLAVQWPKPLLYAAAEPADNAGSDSVAGMEGVDVSMIGLQPYPDPVTLLPEAVRGSAKALNLAAWLDQACKSNTCPYQTIVLDATAMQGLILAEIMGWDDMRKLQSWGSVPREAHFEKADKTRELLRKFAALSRNVIFVCQEKDHNPQKGDNLGSKLVRPAGEGSFFAASLGDSTVEFLHDACPFILQLYQDAELRTIETPITANGKTEVQTMTIPTGRMVRRLRTQFTPNYAGGCRIPKHEAVPQWIEAETPREMYEELVKVSMGIRTGKGKY